MLIFLASVSSEPPYVIEKHPHPVRSALASNPSQGLFCDFIMKLPKNNFYHYISDKLP